MAKKSEYSIFINFFFNSITNRIIHYFSGPQYSLFFFFGSLFTSHYKKGHYSLIIIPHPDPHRGGPMVLLLRKLYLYSTKDPDVFHYFPGGCQTFSRGVQMLISLETHKRTCYFPGGVSGPPIPLWIRTWAILS